MPRSHDRHGYVSGRPHWWQWPTVLSLDAPLVALAWQSGLARAAQVTLRGHHLLILGAGVWLAYAADRWLEGWRLDPAQIRTQRHWFYQRWRWPLAILWMLVLAGALGLAGARLQPAEWAAGLLVLAPVLAYLLSHQLIHRTHPWRAPKEICVALLFGAGAACFPLAGRWDLLPAIAVPLILFTLLCFTNCVLISVWEDDVDRTHGQTSLALQFPQGRPFVRALPWLIAGVAGIASWSAHATGTAVLASAAASGVLLGGVDLAHRRLGRQLARILADVALLTPLVPLWLGQ